MTAPWSYDAIAEVYATDMGASMPFDDVGWYRTLCRQRAGTVLELGCGTGRILLELIAAGIDAFGIDRSLPMLARLRADAQARRLDARVAQMDLRALALDGRFDVVLAPYSLVTYVTAEADLLGLLQRVHALLSNSATLVLDAFVPRPVNAFDDFRLDYRRAYGPGQLERHKRIFRLDDGCNRIERRYRILGADDTVLDEFFTDETIRPYAQDTLIALAQRAGFTHECTVHDYGADTTPAGARFASVVLRRA